MFAGKLIRKKIFKIYSKEPIVVVSVCSKDTIILQKAYKYM